MKTVSYMATMILMSTLIYQPATASTEPSRTAASFDKIYVPSGFDSNDNIEFVGEGVFPNTCYRPADVALRIDKPSKKIFLGAVAYEYQGPCLQMLLPFHRTVSVGILAAGDWTILRASDSLNLGKLTVKQASGTEPDEFPYASISQAFVKQDTGAVQVLLTGNFINSCMELQEVKISVNDNVIVLQPILKPDSVINCKSGQFPFKTWTAIDFLKPIRYLVHVRSMNGNAINSLVDIQ